MLKKKMPELFPVERNYSKLKTIKVGKEEKEHGPVKAGIAGSIAGLHFRFWASLS